MIEFNRYDYLQIRHLERCPYVMFSNESSVWHQKDDNRMLLIALDEYAKVLKGERDASPRAIEISTNNTISNRNRL